MTSREHASRWHSRPGWTSARQRHSPLGLAPRPPTAVPSGLAARLRDGYRLVRTSPGLSVYLLGGMSVWLGYRLLTNQGFAHGLWGTLFVAVLRVLALLLVVLAYFYRTGQLAEVSARLRRARSMATQRGEGCTSARPFLRRRLR